MINSENRKVVPDYVLIIGLCLAALLIRLHFYWLIRHDPTFVMPIIDSMEFDVWGYQISKGQLLWSQVTNHPPLYPYFLGIIYSVFGYSPAKAVIIQYFLSSISIYFLFKIARHYFNTLTAYLSCFLASTFWFFIYVNSFLFSENLSIFLNILMVYILTFFKDGWKKYLTAGLVLGLTEICRPQMVPFAVGYLIWMCFKNVPITRKLWNGFLFLIPLLILNSMVIAHNYRVSGEAVLRTQIGANIYMGNDPAFKGTNIYVKIGRDWEKFISSPDQFYKRHVGERESNEYFLSKTMDIIRTKPLEWGKLIAAKAFSIVTGREFLRTEDVYAYNFYFLETPYCLVTSKLIFLLAVIGLFFSILNRQEIWPMYILVLAIIPILFFPIKTRYLMGLMPFVIIFSAYALASFYSLYQRKDFKVFGLVLFAWTILILLSLWNPLKLTQPDVSETFYAIAKNFDSRKNILMAEKYYQAAIQVDPAHISAYNDLGVLYMNRKDCQRAINYFQKAMILDPEAIYPKLNLEFCQKVTTKL